MKRLSRCYGAHMKIVKLNESHILLIRPLFENSKYMGAFLKTNYFMADYMDPVDHYHKSFYMTYLSGLTNYHAYGAMNDEGNIVALLSFYESVDDASWYGTNIRNKAGKQVVRDLLDTAIKHNEANGRFKFYTLWSSKHGPALRRFIFSKWADERYDYFDEHYIPAKQQCQYNLPWQILYNRTLIPVDTVIRCTFLKQEFRHTLYNAGRI